MRSHIKVSDRLRVQSKALTCWTNCILVKREEPVVDVVAELSKGDLLVEIADTILPEPLMLLRVPPMSLFARVDRLTVALREFRRAGVDTDLIDSSDIISGETKLISVFLWNVAKHYHLPPQDVKVSERVKLLQWVNEMLAGCGMGTVNNFSSRWVDGSLLTSLTAILAPGALSVEDQLDDPLANCERVMAVAESSLGIPRAISAKDLVKRPVDEAVMIYVAFFWRKSQHLEYDGADAADAAAKNSNAVAKNSNASAQKLLDAAADDESQDEDVFIIVTTDDGSELDSSDDDIDSDDGMSQMSQTRRSQPNSVLKLTSLFERMAEVECVSAKSVYTADVDWDQREEMAEDDEIEADAEYIMDMPDVEANVAASAGACLEEIDAEAEVSNETDADAEIPAEVMSAEFPSPTFDDYNPEESNVDSEALGDEIADSEIIRPVVDTEIPEEEAVAIAEFPEDEAMAIAEIPEAAVDAAADVEVSEEPTVDFEDSDKVITNFPEQCVAETEDPEEEAAADADFAEDSTVAMEEPADATADVSFPNDASKMEEVDATLPSAGEIIQADYADASFIPDEASKMEEDTADIPYDECIVAAESAVESEVLDEASKLDEVIGELPYEAVVDAEVETSIPDARMVDGGFIPIADINTSDEPAADAEVSEACVDDKASEGTFDPEPLVEGYSMANVFDKHPINNDEDVTVEASEEPSVDADVFDERSINNDESRNEGLEEATGLGCVASEEHLTDAYDFNTGFPEEAAEADASMLVPETDENPESLQCNDEQKPHTESEHEAGAENMQLSTSLMKSFAVSMHPSNSINHIIHDSTPHKFAPFSNDSALSSPRSISSLQAAMEEIADIDEPSAPIDVQAEIGALPVILESPEIEGHPDSQEGAGAVDEPSFNSLPPLGRRGSLPPPATSSAFAPLSMSARSSSYVGLPPPREPASVASEEPVSSKFDESASAGAAEEPVSSEFEQSASAGAAEEPVSSEFDDSMPSEIEVSSDDSEIHISPISEIVLESVADRLAKSSEQMAGRGEDANVISEMGEVVDDLISVALEMHKDSKNVIPDFN